MLVVEKTCMIKMEQMLKFLSFNVETLGVVFMAQMRLQNFKARSKNTSASLSSLPRDMYG